MPSPVYSDAVTSNMLWKCTVSSFEIKSIPIISYLLNGSYSCNFSTSLSWTDNEFVVLIMSPGWEIWSVKYSLILERSWQTSLTHSITQSPHIIDLVAHCFSVLKLKLLKFYDVGWKVFWWLCPCSRILILCERFCWMFILCLLKD